VKRSPALAPLSRDHQHALYAALRLRRAEAEGLSDAVDHFLRFFDDEGRRHFEIEEELILRALPDDEGNWTAAVERVREDHAAIRQATAQAEWTSESAQALGTRLNDHVRFEERVLFPIVEERLAPEDLERLGVAVAEAERANAR
jgi:hemerythrin-like domain-containing protein